MTETTWLTQDAFDRLQAEYDDRTGPLRTDITKKIEAAREEGDLKENGGYHAAKDEQGKNEARIRQLRQLLENAQRRRGARGRRHRQGRHGRHGPLPRRQRHRDSSCSATARPTPAGHQRVLDDLAARRGRARQPVGETVAYELPNGKQLTVDIVDAVPYEA